MKAIELREMSDEQLQATLRETIDQLFRLRIQAQTERLDAPSELRRNRRLVARIKTEPLKNFTPPRYFVPDSISSSSGWRE